MVPRGWFRKSLFHEKFWQVKYYSHTLKTIGTDWPIQVSLVVLSCPTRLNPDCHSTELKVSASKCLYRRERTGPKRLSAVQMEQSMELKNQQILIQEQTATVRRLSAVQKLLRKFKKTVSGWMLQVWNSSWDWSKLWVWWPALPPSSSSHWTSSSSFKRSWPQRWSRFTMPMRQSSFDYSK